MQEVSPLMQEAAYRRGETIIARGTRGRGLFFVKKGSAEAVISDEQGHALPVARFGPGSYFGEMALLTGQRTSADVIAGEDCVIGIVTRPDFECLLSNSVVLGRHFATTLARRLDEANRNLLDVYRRQSALADFLRREEDVEALVGESRRTKKVIDAAREAAKNAEPVRIIGEAGAGTRPFARLIHDERA
ncbi:MAG: cyclic nucleotide-binding domain-containing protein, partial [Armatimonadota bacterium]